MVWDKVNFYRDLIKQTNKAVEKQLFEEIIVRLNGIILLLQETDDTHVLCDSETMGWLSKHLQD